MIKVFDWKCKDCDTVAEYYTKREEVPTCKECGSSELIKLPSSTRFNMNKTPYEEFL